MLKRQGSSLSSPIFNSLKRDLLSMTSLCRECQCDPWHHEGLDLLRWCNSNCLNTSFSVRLIMAYYSSGGMELLVD